MEVLVRARPLILSVFFIALAALFVTAFATPWLMDLAAVAAHVALLFFLLTESFGSVSGARSKTSRVIARVCLTLSFLLVGTLAVNGLWWVLS